MHLFISSNGDLIQGTLISDDGKVIYMKNVTIYHTNNKVVTKDIYMIYKSDLKSITDNIEE